MHEVCAKLMGFLQAGFFQSIMTVVFQLQHVNIRQHNSVMPHLISANVT